MKANTKSSSFWADLGDMFTFDDEEQLEFFERFRVTRNMTVGKIPLVLRIVIWPLIRLLDSCLEGYHQIYVAEDKKKREWWEMFFFSINLPIVGFYLGWDGVAQVPLPVKLGLTVLLYVLHSHPDLYQWLSEKKIERPTLHRALDGAIATFIIAVLVRTLQILLFPAA